MEFDEVFGEEPGFADYSDEQTTTAYRDSYALDDERQIEIIQAKRGLAVDMKNMYDSQRSCLELEVQLQKERQKTLRERRAHQKMKSKLERERRKRVEAEAHRDAEYVKRVELEIKLERQEDERPLCPDCGRRKKNRADRTGFWCAECEG